MRTIRHDYMARWHMFHLTPLFDKASAITGLLITMTDIHARHDASRPGGRQTPDA